MLFKRPKSLMIVIILLLVLAILSATSAFTTPAGLARPAGAPGAPAAGQAAGGFTGNGGGTGTGAGKFTGNTGGTRSAAGGGFNFNTILRALGMSGQALTYVTLGLGILGILLVLLGAFGTWKLKAWGLNLGILMALVFLASAVPGLLSLGRNFNLLRTSFTVLTLLASLPILVLGALPSTRELVKAHN